MNCNTTVFPTIILPCHTDYQVINQLHYLHKVAATTKDAAHMSINQTSIDMNMAAVTTNFYQEMIDLVHEGQIPESRIDESVERIMQMKKDLGLLDPNYMQNIYDPNAKVGTDEDKAKALAAARESIILLENNGILPLSPNNRLRVLLTGKPTYPCTIVVPSHSFPRRTWK